MIKAGLGVLEPPDAPDLGASGLTVVEVRVPSPSPCSLLRPYVAILFLLFLPTIAPAENAAFPLKVSENHRYLVDQNNTPFFFMGDASPQQMFTVLNESQMTTYFETRSAQGFNAVWMFALCGDTEVPCQKNLATYDGLLPFASGNFPTYNLANPNPAYWERMDSYIRMAAQYNMVVVFFVFDTNNNMAIAEKAGNAGMYGFGQWLGNRYKSYPNIIWAMGNDFQTWRKGLIKGTKSARTAARHNALIKNLMGGILNSDSSHLMLTELQYMSSLGSDDALLQPYNTIRSVYTYYCTYPKVYASYNATPEQPSMWIEGGWEYSDTSGMAYSEKNIRQEEWYNFLAGGLGGFMWANDKLTSGKCCTNYVAELKTIGASQFGVVKRVLTGIPWYELVPDQSHSLMTAGYGKQNTIDSGLDISCLNSTNYVTTALTADHKYSVSYAPVPTTLSLNMAEYATMVTLHWVDPTNGAIKELNGGAEYANAGTQTFTTPGENAEGATDWVLVAATTSGAASASGERWRREEARGRHP
jgi:hypothetical protein